MTQDRPGTRSHEHVIEIDASPEDVWRAISDAEEVIRWYAPEAEIDGRVGGAYKVSWGEGMDGGGVITAYEPGRYLKLEYVQPEDSTITTGPIAEEYFISSDGERTILRLVTSGVPDLEDWDWFYDGQKRGWPGFFVAIRHYLENHRGVPRDQIVSMTAVPTTCEEAWPMVMGADGLGVAGSLAESGAGGRYRGTTAFGQDIEGELMLVGEPNRLVATVEGVNNALLAIGLEPWGPTNMVYLSLSTFGLDAKTVEDLSAKWLGWLNSMFPEAEHPAAAFQELAEDTMGVSASAEPERG